jgi:hypothetical protein
MTFGVKDTDAAYPVSPHFEQIVANEAGQAADARLDQCLNTLLSSEPESGLM